MLCRCFGFFVPEGFDRCVQLDNHAGEPLCEGIVNIARHARALLQQHGMPPLLSELGAVSRYHHVMRQRLGQFDLFRAICSSFNMLNTNEAADFSQHKHRDSQELLASSIHQVFPEFCTKAGVLLDVVAHHRTLRKQHLLKTSFPCLRLLDERMLQIRRDWLVTLDHEMQAQRVCCLVPQQYQDATRVQVLANCSKHLCDELLWSGFSCQDIETTHHHFHMATRELFGSTQSLLCTIAFNSYPHQVRRQLNQAEILRRGTSRLTIVHGESPQHFFLGRENRRGPTSTQRM